MRELVGNTEWTKIHDALELLLRFTTNVQSGDVIADDDLLRMEFP